MLLWRISRTPRHHIKKQRHPFADKGPHSERLLLSCERCQDSWPPERNSIQGQWWGLTTQSFCVIKFLLKYERDGESFWHRHQKRAERVPPASLQQDVISLFILLQSLSHVRLFTIPWTPAHQASLSFTNSRSLLKLMSIKSVMQSNHLILCHPPLPLPSIFPSIRVFSNESALRIRWPKYWNFSFNISPSKEHPGLISFTMDWLDLLAVQGTLKTLLQHHSSKASIL